VYASLSGEERSLEKRDEVVTQFSYSEGLLEDVFSNCEERKPQIRLV
jgi:hypothetical protein